MSIVWLIQQYYWIWVSVSKSIVLVYSVPYDVGGDRLELRDDDEDVCADGRIDGTDDGAGTEACVDSSSSNSAAML